MSVRPSVSRSKSVRSRSVARMEANDQPVMTLHDEAGFEPRDFDPANGEFVSTSVAEIRRKGRNEELRATSRKYFVRFVALIGFLVVLLAGWAVLYNSTAFTIERVSVKGVEHLTDDEMTQLANVPSNTTLLRVDADEIANRVKQNSWVEDVQINRIPPDTLEINVTERKVAAIVEIPDESGTMIKRWMIANDHMWLMPIPEEGTEAAQTTSPKVYEDADAVRHIVNVPVGTKAEIGHFCADSNINNSLDILNGMTTELAEKVIRISAPGPAETTLVLENGVEVAFGDAEDIRDKERVINEILGENPDGVSYINVRMVETPTWRSIY